MQRARKVEIIESGGIYIIYMPPGVEAHPHGAHGHFQRAVIYIISGNRE